MQREGTAARQILTTAGQLFPLFSYLFGYSGSRRTEKAPEGSLPLELFLFFIEIYIPRSVYAASSNTCFCFLSTLL